MDPLSPRRFRAATFIVLAGLGLSALACSSPPGGTTSLEPPALVEPVVGSDDLYTITLTARAAERLDIQTAATRASGADILVPYSALFYGPDGETWVYVNLAPLTYVREEVEVADILEGEDALLSLGPPPGTAVVTVGVAELYGTEFEVGH